MYCICIHSEWHMWLSAAAIVYRVCIWIIICCAMMLTVAYKLCD